VGVNPDQVEDVGAVNAASGDENADRAYRRLSGVREDIGEVEKRLENL
jgi:hypothetical protein